MTISSPPVRSASWSSVASASATAQTTRGGLPRRIGRGVDRGRVSGRHQLRGAGRGPGHRAQRGLPRAAHDQAVNAGCVEGADGLAEVERVLDAIEGHEQRPLRHLGEQLVDRTLAALPDQADHAPVGPPPASSSIRSASTASMSTPRIRASARPSQAPISRPDSPDALNRAYAGLQDRLDRKMALDHERPARVGHLAQRWAEGRGGRPEPRPPAQRRSSPAGAR